MKTPIQYKPTDRPIDRTRREKDAAGFKWEAFVSLGGYSYHRTEAAAETAARRRASKLAQNAGCPDNPPCWSVNPCIVRAAATGKGEA